MTGSGKTEVYLQAMSRALANGQTALLMVPEISLTPQIVSRVRARFGSQVAVLHSGLSTGERYDEWRRIERGEARVVVGARSSIFAPLQNLGIIIMDEEHETSYKQDDTPVIMQGKLQNGEHITIKHHYCLVLRPLAWKVILEQWPVIIVYCACHTVSIKGHYHPLT